MRRARITFNGAYHHVMNKGIEGKDIFFDENAIVYFLESMKEKSNKLKMRILAYCIMPNHFHLIVQNSSGKLSAFMKQLNGQYGMYYRKKKGGRGHVFQGRFKSTLIQEDTYMRMVIIYVLLNPVRKGIVSAPRGYRWSSIGEYYSEEDSPFVDNKFLEGMFNSEEEMYKLLNEWKQKDLPIRKTRIGDILGEDVFIKESIKRFDRRRKRTKSRNMRLGDYRFRSFEEIIKEFEEEKGIKLNKISLNTHKGKQLRGELLVLLKDEGGLTYSEIVRTPVFQSLKYSSLGKLYKRALKRMKKE
ncbi:transposase [candidate division WOR-3 bacterium]|nr:transposase [candidate division WOR-3 bacterium]